MMKFVAIIPARYASSRFPAKPLAVLGGKPVIQRVYEQVSSVLPDVYVATDDDRIFNAVEAFGGKAVMTSVECKSGTDRVAQAVGEIGVSCDVVVNVQGDEPFIHPTQITSLCSCFDEGDTQIATLAKPFSAMDEVQDPNSPKVILDNRSFAMYFSRSVIPYVRGVEPSEWLNSYRYLKHIGIYAYRTRVLEDITKLPQSTLEQAESLEQLRWLQNGYRIKVALTDRETVGIDTPADLKRAEEFLSLESRK